MPTARHLRLIAPAKVNLLLRIRGQRSDGLHELAAPTVPIDLCDEVEAAVDHSGKISSQLVGMATPEDELAARAARLLQQAARVSAGVRLRIIKRIPAGAGLGGASSDAAAAMHACNRLWQLNFSPQRLSEIAMQAGADVPFFIYCRQACLRGAGERLQPLPQTVSGCCVLAICPEQASTADVFRRYSAGLSQKIVRLRRSSNDLLAAACAEVPALADLIEMVSKVAGNARLTGSGSCVYALMPDLTSAQRVARDLRSRTNCRLELAAVLRQRPQYMLGESPSGKAADFGSAMRRFESCLPSPALA